MQVICRRCLLEQMQEETALHTLVQDWIAAIPEDNRAPAKAYRARLGACQQCAELANGMCRLCGCYVELRAAKTLQSCPKIPQQW